MDPVSEEVCQLIKASIYPDLHKAKVPRYLLSGSTIDTERLIEDSIKLELNYAATARSTVSQGAKPEDARHYISMFRKHGWRVPLGI